jgi:hypothetical protein
LPLSEAAHQIVDAFFTTKPQGSGVGLPISKSIIESQGGRIWANGNGECGATFTSPCQWFPRKQILPWVPSDSAFSSVGAQVESGNLMHDRLSAFRGQTSCDPPIVHGSGLEAAHMRKRNRRPPCRKIVLKLPDLDHAKSAVLNSLSSPHSRRNYKFAMEQFISWYCSEPRLALNRTVVLRFRLYLESLGLAAGKAEEAAHRVHGVVAVANDIKCGTRRSSRGWG